MLGLILVLYINAIISSLEERILNFNMIGYKHCVHLCGT